MAIASPLELVTAAEVPATVQWRPLSGMPAAPVTLAGVQALAISGLAVDVAYGAPEVIEANQLAYRGFTLVLSVPQTGEGLPFPPIVAMGLIETAEGESLLAVWQLDQAQTLTQAGQALEIAGYLQVSTLGGGNG